MNYGKMSSADVDYQQTVTIAWIDYSTSHYPSEKQTLSRSLFGANGLTLAAFPGKAVQIA